MHAPTAILAAAVLFLSTPVWAADYPVYRDDGVLTLPRVDIPDQVGKYQEVTFQLTPQGVFELSGIQVLGTRKLSPVWGFNAVEVIKTATFPVSVYLRASGSLWDCGYSGPGRIHQRLEGTRFDVGLSFSHIDAYVNFEIVCTANMRDFKMTVPLEVYGLSAGTYSYNVHGITGTFSLESDNKFPDDCDAASETGCQ